MGNGETEIKEKKIKELIEGNIFPSAQMYRNFTQSELKEFDKLVDEDYKTEMRKLWPQGEPKNKIICRVIRKTR